MLYRVENIVRKGEIACYKQFHLFSQCFPQQYIYLVDQNAALCGNWLKAFSHFTTRFRKPLLSGLLKLWIVL